MKVQNYEVAMTAVADTLLEHGYRPTRKTLIHKCERCGKRRGTYWRGDNWACLRCLGSNDVKILEALGKVYYGDTEFAIISPGEKPPWER